MKVAFAPSTVIPAPSAAALLAAPLATVIFLSVTSSVEEDTVVVVPLTVKLPVTVMLLLTVVVPVAAPILKAVAAFAKLTVVAVVLIRSNDALGVVRDVVIAGLVPNTNAPEPVSSVIALAKLALDGVPKNVATPEPKDVIPVPPLATGNVPVTPVVNGSPVALVRVPELGVPRAGVTKVGLVASTILPEPVLP